MAANSVWAPAHNVTVNLGAGAIPCTDGSLSITVGEFETTNTLSPVSTGGEVFYEGGNDTITVELSFKLPWDTLNPPAAIGMGKLVSGVSYAGADGVTHAGSIRVTKVGKPISAKGGFMLDVSGKFTGLVSNI